MTRLQAFFDTIGHVLPSGPPPLLITSSVHPHAPFVELSSAEERIAYTLEALGKWLTLSNTLTIVICDGSSFDFSKLVKARFPTAKIECLSFENDQDAVSKFGKGWGEGEIVKYALQSSSLLRKAKAFAKCTAKIFLSNFVEILEFWNGAFLCDCRIDHPYDRKRINIRWVDTKFYVVDKSLYLNKFVNVHLDVRDREGRYLEHCFRDLIVGENMDGFMLPIMPLYEGVSGTTAKTLPHISTERLEKDGSRRESVGRLTNYISHKSA